MELVNIVILSVIIILLIMSCKNRTEHFTTTNEAVQNIASVYNNNNMSVVNANFTGTVNTNIHNSVKSTINDLSVSTFNLLPRGTIVMWNGSVAPNGWTLCDGSNGSPDLRGRFVRMYSDNMDGSWESWGAKLLPDGDTNVAYERSIAGRSRNDARTWMLKHRLGDKGGTDHQELTIPELPPHTHEISVDTTGGWNGTRTQGSDRGQNGTTKTGSVGSGNGHNNQPLYYVLAFIMKL